MEKPKSLSFKRAKCQTVGRLECKRARMKDTLDFTKKYRALNCNFILDEINFSINSQYIGVAFDPDKILFTPTDVENALTTSAR